MSDVFTGLDLTAEINSFGVRVSGMGVIRMLRDIGVGVLLCNGADSYTSDRYSCGTIRDTEGNVVTSEITPLEHKTSKKPLWFTSLRLDFGNKKHNFDGVVQYDRKTGDFVYKGKNLRKMKWRDRRYIRKYIEGTAEDTELSKLRILRAGNYQIERVVSTGGVQLGIAIIRCIE